MERIKLILIICACIFVRSGQSMTIEELSPLLETLKAGIRTEILSEITSVTTELGNNVITTGEIVGAVQNQEELIKRISKELNETKLLLKDAIELNQKEIKKTIESQSIELNYLKKEFKADINSLNETQVDVTETMVGLEECHNEIKAAIGNQSNVIKSTQKEVKDTIEAQIKELNDLKHDFKGVVKDLNETQVDIAVLETTINGLEVAIGNQSYQFNELQIELKGIQDNQSKIEYTANNHSETLHGLVLNIDDCEKNHNENQAITTNHTEQLSGLKIDVEGIKTRQSQIEGFIEEHSNQIGAVMLEQNKTRAVPNENSSELGDLEAHFDEMKEGELQSLKKVLVFFLPCHFLF